MCSSNNSLHITRSTLYNMSSYKFSSMEYGDWRDQRKGRPLPKRGQIKAKIIGGLVRSVTSLGSKKREKLQEGEYGESAPVTPPPSGYASEASYEA